MIWYFHIINEKKQISAINTDANLELQFECHEQNNIWGSEQKKFPSEKKPRRVIEW